MACLNLSLPAPPQIPPVFISLPAFNFTLSFGQIGVTCCTIKLPSFSLPVTIPSPGSIFATIIAVLNALIVAAWPTLDLMIPACPMNGKSLSDI